MQFNIHVHGPINVQFPDLARRLDRIEALLRQSIHQEKIMSQELSDLTAQVEATNGVMESATVALNGVGAKLTTLAEQLAAAGIDNTQVISLRDSLASETSALAAAVAAIPPTP